jgi:SAM-dependent methyltransferase
MLAEARKLASERGLTNLETARADAAGLPFAADSFDLVTCRIAAHHFADPRGFAAEASRVLHGGGRLALVDNVAPDRALSPQETEADLAGAAACYNDFERLRDPSHDRCLGLEEWQGLLAETGFVVLHGELLAKPMDFASWADRMGVSPKMRQRLEGLLRNSSGVLGKFLAPRDEGGRLLFTLHEGIIIAARPERQGCAPEGN